MNETYTYLLNIIKTWQISDEDVKVDWNVFKEQVNIHKIGGLLYSRLVEKENYSSFPSDVKDLLQETYEENIEKYNVYYKEFMHLINQFNRVSLDVVPVKGISLIHRIYENPGERTLNDFDFLLLQMQKKRVIMLLNECGYKEGNLGGDNEIIPIKRKVSVFTKLYTDGLNPFYKYDKNNIFLCDLRVRISGNADTVAELIKNSSISGQNHIKVLAVYDELIYLCEHLYREATSIVSIYNNKDLILIKFIDIHLFWDKYKNNIDIDNFITTVHKYGLESCVYYTFYYMAELFDIESYKSIICKLKDIKIEEIDLIGENDLGKNNYIKPKKSFIERLFAVSNENEIRERPRWKDIE